MFRAIRRLVILLSVALIAGGLLLTLTGKPRLEKAHRDVAQEWARVRTQLNTRYTDVDVVVAALRSSGRDLSITESLRGAQSTWKSSTSSGSDADAITRQINAANSLEGLLRRIRGIIAASPRFSNNAELTVAFDRLNRSVSDPAQIETVNRAIESANNERNGFLRRLVASALGYHDVPYFVGD